MNTKILLISILFGFISFQLLAQKDTSKVKWQSFEETKNLFEKNQKPVLIYFHDENNDSSNLMINQTFGLQEVASYINALFYPIKIDIYSKDTLTFFDGKTYSNQNKEGSVHDMVTSLLGKDVQMPAMILFTTKAIGTVFQGFKDRNRIFPILIYYAESVYNSTTYEKFERYYFKTYPPGQSQIMTRVLLKWKSLDEVVELNKTNPRKIIINIYDNYNISSTMLNLKTFNNPIIADYLNKNYYCVNLDSRAKDTLNFLSQKYINEGAPHGFHQLPIAILSGKMLFPAFVFLDENLKLIDLLQMYMAPDDFEVLIHFVAENGHNEKKWEEYKTNFKSSFMEETQ